MIFLVHYTLEIDGKLCEAKKGLIWGGNSSYVFEKACEAIGYPVSFNPDNIVSHSKYVFKRELKRPNGERIDIVSERHTICIAPPGEMVTVFKRSPLEEGGE
jgi:hypothetical protein